MTDFLSRLAERTLGLVPSVQPLLASRYAPASEAFRDAYEQSPPSLLPPALQPVFPPDPQQNAAERGSDATDVNRSVHSQPSERLDTQTSMLPQPTVRHAPAQTVDDALTSRPMTSKAIDRSLASESLPTADSRRSPATERISQRTTMSPAPLPTWHDQDVAANVSHSLHRSLRSQRTGTEASADLSRSQVDPTHSEMLPLDGPGAAPLHHLSVPPPAIDATIDQTHGDFVQSQNASVPTQTSVPRPRFVAQQSDHLPENASEPPVIRITIGRIEVRAIPPPPLTPTVERPAPARPVLSLDQYLRRHSEGQR